MQSIDNSGPVVTGNYYDKYGSRNPLVKRMMAGFFSAFDDFVGQSGATHAHEVGCGEGHLLARMLDKGVMVRGSDIGADVIAEAQHRFNAAGQQVALKQGTIESMQAERDSAELIVCCEVLEHVEDPDVALAQLSLLGLREQVWL